MTMAAPGNDLAVWHLQKPDVPVKVGVVSLALGGRGLSFAYHPAWRTDGFALSGDMPLEAAAIISSVRDTQPGALQDAMPDRWGERSIRFLDKPKRVTALDLLYYAGDGRFGALGFSIDQTAYLPHSTGPLLDLGSLHELQELIHRIELGEPLTEREKLIASSSRTMGGAHPKALVVIDGIESIAKFPRGLAIDVGLVEHASLILASLVGIECAASQPIRSAFGNIVAISRFDRTGSQRAHVLSAKTVLEAGVDQSYQHSGELSYGAMADFLRNKGVPATHAEQSTELFRRMVFNILIDNTDDHEKNHAFIRVGAHWSLAPAYDVLPLTQNAGLQQMIVGAFGSEGTKQNALSQAARFGLNRSQALAEWERVAHQVNRWDEVFHGVGVTGADIDYLRDFIDSEDKLKMRTNAF
ncbi:MAG: HipA domain-containing protein [Burkholderiaceae bacterium]